VREPNDKTKLLTLRREMKETVEELQRARIKTYQRLVETRAEVERLRGLLARYARHDNGCTALWRGEMCDPACGLDAALRGEGGRGGYFICEKPGQVHGMDCRCTALRGEEGIPPEVWGA